MEGGWYGGLPESDFPPAGGEAKTKGKVMKTKKKALAAAEEQHPSSDRLRGSLRSGDMKAEYARRRIEVDVDNVRVAAWNPRGKITPESVADLAASIRTLGLIQPVVCMMERDGSLTLIAGHRRLVAAKLAGLKTIPCEALDGLDEATAKRMTFIENLQRADADPLLEAELVSSLVQSGMTQAEIAAETGRGVQWVARRANLVNLSPSWRKRVRDGEQITIDCLEHVAAYPLEVQEKCKEASGSYYGNSQGVAWHDVKWQFQRESRDLRAVVFDTERCRACPNNTGCCPELFDDVANKDNLGQCLDAHCFARKTDDAVCDAVEKAEAKGRTVVKNKQPYQCGVYGATKRPTKTNTALYVYTDCNGSRVMEYAAPPPKKDEAEAAKEKEAKKAEREAAKFRKLVDEARNEAADRFNAWIDEHEKDGVWPKWFVDEAIMALCEDIRVVGADQADAVDAFAMNTGFTANDAEADKAYREYLAKQEGEKEGAK